MKIERETQFIKNGLWLTLAVLIILVLGVKTDFVSMLQGCEIAISLIAISFSILCLHYVYQEHKTWYLKERKLKKALINKIYHDCSHLPPKEKIEESLEELLQAKNTPQRRVATLSQFGQDPKILNKFVEHLHQQQSDQEVLEDLGLSWN